MSSEPVTSHQGPEVAQPCPVCGDGGKAPEFPDATGPAKLHPLERCVECGLVSMREHRTEEDLDAAQADAYGEQGARFNPLIEAGVRGFRAARVRLAMRLMPAGASVLDVGCGRGLFLAMMRERGYRVRGTELSATTAANAYPGVPIEPGELVPGRFEPGAFDLISIWHVLEHMRRPDVALAAAHEALGENGRLLIAVPNYASWQARLGGEHWFHLDVPRHIHQFSPATLRRLVERHGFDIERLSTGQWEMDPFGLLQTALNRLGTRHNALYDALRNNPAVHADLSPVTRAAALVVLVVGMAFAMPASLFARAAGRAGTVILVARKAKAGS